MLSESGMLDLVEFVLMYQDRCKNGGDPKENLRKAFKRFDEKNTGYLTNQQLMLVHSQCLYENKLVYKYHVNTSKALRRNFNIKALNVFRRYFMVLTPDWRF